jgi:hypothetical protein
MPTLPWRRWPTASGYPFLAPTALSRRLVEMKLPYFFLLLQQPKADVRCAGGHAQGQQGQERGLIYVDDLFGLENFAALKVALQGSGISLVEDKSYPGGVKDLSPVLRSIKDKNPDAFRRLHLPARHHPGQQAGQGSRLQPEVLLRVGGHGLPAVQERHDAGRRRRRAGHGQSWNGKTSPAPRPTSTPHQEVRRQGARPLGQRRLLGGAGDPDGRGGKGTAWTARPSATTWPTPRTRPSSATSVHRQRERGHAGHGEPVAERRVRGGVAAQAGHGEAEPAKPAWK